MISAVVMPKKIIEAARSPEANWKTDKTKAETTPVTKVSEFASFKSLSSPLARYVVTVMFSPIVPKPEKMVAMEI